MQLAWVQLRTLILARAPSPVEVFSADHDASGALIPRAGVTAVLERLRTGAAAGNAPPAILLVGLYDESALRKRVAPKLGAPNLFDWPGLRYLRLMFDEDELRKAMTAVATGRIAPLPLPTARELARHAARVAHWLGRIDKGLAGEAVVFAEAARGATELSPAMLAPRPTLSREHDDSLAGLAAALHLAPDATGGDDIRPLVEALRVAGARLEAARARGDKPGLADAAAALREASHRLSGQVVALADRLAHEAAL